MTLFLNEGIQEEQHSKSLEQGFKINTSVFKLNPLMIKYDNLNLNNGGKITTHSDW